MRGLEEMVKKITILILILIYIAAVYEDANRDQSPIVLGAVHTHSNRQPLPQKTYSREGPDSVMSSRQATP